jgi:hypothetical protein
LFVVAIISSVSGVKPTIVEPEGGINPSGFISYLPSLLTKIYDTIPTLKRPVCTYCPA